MAHWLGSPHNFGLAIDIFFLINGKAQWPRDLFNEVFASDLPGWIKWLKNSTVFPELPHFQVGTWESLVKDGVAQPVE